METTAPAVDVLLDGRQVDPIAAPVVVAVVVVAMTPGVADRWSLVDAIRPRYGGGAPRTTATSDGESHDATSSPSS